MDFGELKVVFDKCRLTIYLTVLSHRKVTNLSPTRLRRLVKMTLDLLADRVRFTIPAPSGQVNFLTALLCLLLSKDQIEKDFTVYFRLFAMELPWSSRRNWYLIAPYLKAYLTTSSERSSSSNTNPAVPDKDIRRDALFMISTVCSLYPGIFKGADVLFASRIAKRFVDEPLPIDGFHTEAAMVSALMRATVLAPQDVGHQSFSRATIFGR
jgi:hypothetical protein